MRVKALSIISGNLALATGQWALVSFFSKTGNLALLGAYSLSLALISPVIAFANFGFRATVISNVDDAGLFGRLLKVRIIVILSIVALCVPIVFYADLVPLSLFIIIIIVKTVESLSDLCFGEFHRRDEGGRQGGALLIRVFFSVCFFYVIYEKTSDLTAALLGVALGSFLAFLFIELRQIVVWHASESAEWLIDYSFVTSALRKGVRLSFSSAIGAISFNFINYVLGFALGLAVLGVYTSIFSIVALMNIGAITIAQIFSSRVSKLFHDKNAPVFFRELFRGAAVILLGCSFATIISLLWGNELLFMAFGKIPEPYDRYFIWVVVAACPGVFAQYFANIFSCLGNFEIVFRSSVVSLISVVLCGWLILRFGIDGALVSTFVSGFAQCVVLTHGLLHVKVLSGR